MGSRPLLEETGCGEVGTESQRGAGEASCSYFVDVAVAVFVWWGHLPPPPSLT